jgi:hypothetical protein
MSAVQKQMTEPAPVDADKPPLRLYRPMLRIPWKLSQAKRRAIVDRVFEIVMTGTTAERLAAVRLMLEMDRSNLGRLRLWFEECKVRKTGSGANAQR